MDNFIGNIFYFGSPKDGFKVYPDLGPVSSTFASYYTNTATDWVLVAKKSNNVTSYIYVEYGLLTSVENGRTGSCLGISIEFIDYYFTDLELLRIQVIEKIRDSFITDNILLEIQGNTGILAFKAYNLNAVSQYLDTKSQIIRKVIAENYLDNIKPSDYIPDSTSNPVYEVNPKSSFEAITELFETYGIVKLSPSGHIEIKSVSQKKEEQISALQRKIETLNYHLKMKDIENSALKTELNKFKKGTNFEPSPASQHWKQDNDVKEKANLSKENLAEKESLWNLLSPQMKVVVTILSTMVALVVFLIFTNSLFSTSTIEPIDTTDRNINQSKTQTTYQASMEEVPSVREAGRKGFLNADAFLQNYDGRFIADRDGFKLLLTSYLLEKNSKIRQMYNNDANKLWNKILELNPTEFRKFIEPNQSIIIERNNSYQKKVLDNLLIYSE